MIGVPTGLPTPVKPMGELMAEIVRLEKALASTEALWRQERDRVRELEAQRDEIMTAIERFTKGGKDGNDR